MGRGAIWGSKLAVVLTVWLVMTTITTDAYKNPQAETLIPTGFAVVLGYLLSNLNKD